ncbi:pyruvate dehydrogenase complex dihydrolipoamide acetyltransferase [Govanella unica]|uniref:Acetyltransferase component of pyruvate dehydrogenase complex n=1 Tax=Govanella unica TaxID=2975056 RepID=A0A9X3Z784_9PROT|nr:pyruvate dehydrogenase complex dihydrolipoamide acetyltransferase [Govania unica]MDA5193803.1 pyruvate dehydrogenase complex dihydrolipoamide acetyltransferase [Govania unica]
MSFEITMPALSPTMEKGNLAKWLVKEGDVVKSGDVIAEIETDKATMEVEAVDEGTVGKILVAEGTSDVPVGTLIAVLLEEGETEVAVPAAAKKAEPQPKAEAPKVEAVVPKAVPVAPDDSRVIASPLARRIAKQTGIDLTAVHGSGPGGRIIKRDLEETVAVAKPVPKAAAPKAAAAPVAGQQDIPFEEIRLSGMRKVIAERLSESKRTIPHFYLTVDVTLDKLMALRKEINQDEGVKLSVNDFIIKALAKALVAVPDANVQFHGDKLLKFSRADVSVAVAIEGGLMTPIIRDAANKGIAAIGAEMKALAEKARTGKLMPQDYQGGTVSLSNLGMFGIRQFDAVINPPQAAILAVGAGEQRAIVKNGAIEIAMQMTVTLSCDHRAIDGAVGAQFLTAFKALIENPMRMLL